MLRIRLDTQRNEVRATFENNDDDDEAEEKEKQNKKRYRTCVSSRASCRSTDKISLLLNSVSFDYFLSLSICQYFSFYKYEPINGRFTICVNAEAEDNDDDEDDVIVGR
jgi:hypothetical protein